MAPPTSSDEASLGQSFIGNWVEESNAFLFFSAPAEKQVAGLLQKRPELRLEDNFHFTYEDWQGGGLDPLEIGPFLVIPPWLEIPETHHGMKILLDPGVVFGNCLHPTTRTCLEALPLIAAQSPLGRVLDLGTGTGILAMAAALLAAHDVLAVDLNPPLRQDRRLQHPVKQAGIFRAGGSRKSGGFYGRGRGPGGGQHSS